MKVVKAISVVRPEDDGPHALITFDPLPEATFKDGVVEPIGSARTNKGAEAAATVPVGIEAHYCATKAIVDAMLVDVDIGASHPIIVRPEAGEGVEVTTVAIPDDTGVHHAAKMTVETAHVDVEASHPTVVCLEAARVNLATILTN